ncbi:MAG: molybdenum cofactor guanylyltransferase MobA [Flavimaricola sp.]|nr:molybdenum cofactor guanylyltransferase MobA [Flavimaricola sp.]
MSAPAPSPLAQIPGVILAGGRSRRMGGGDKAMAMLGQRRLLDHVIDRASRQCAPLALNANGDPDRFAPCPLHVLTDTVTGHLGPLAGIHTAMGWAEGLGHACVVTLAVDTPFFPEDLTARLWAASEGRRPAIAARTGANGEVWPHPIFGLWPVALRPGLAEALARGNRRVTDWAVAEGASLVAFDGGEIDPFFNINTPEDLAHAAGWLQP